MWYAVVLVPWTDMIRWLDFLEEQCSDWDFCYPMDVTGRTQKDNFISILLDYSRSSLQYEDSPAHMQVKLSADDMMLMKLSWNVGYSSQDLTTLGLNFNGPILYG